MQSEVLTVDVNVDIRKNSTQNVGVTLMSQDINNYSFYLRVLQDGELLVMDETYEVEVLSVFTTSKSRLLTKGTIKSQYVDWVFDTSYISKSEVVKNYVYVRKNGVLLVSADANCFIFSVGLSEIDKGAGKVAETYDENYEKVLADYSGALDERTTERLDLAVLDFNQRGDTEIADWRTSADSELSDWLGDANGKVAEFDSVLNSKADKADLDDLSSLLSWQTAKDVVGLEVDFENSIFTRLSGAVGLSAGSDFDKLRAFGGRRRCILSDNGEVLAYHGDANYIEDGSLGQVMVEQPKFYYKVVPLKIEPIVDGKGHHLRKARYYVSDTKQVGFKVHPAFVRNGEELNNIYLSAYEGSLYDVSASVYNLTDIQAGDFTATTGDKLSSIANAKPASGLTQGLTRSGSRIVAQNRGAGWGLMYAATVAATQMLFMIEYGTFNTQTALGIIAGVIDDGATNMSALTGATSTLGNTSGESESGSVTYRGEENFWGNTWSWIDGMNIKPQGLNELYVADNSFADNKGDGTYKNAGITISKVNGYVSSFAYNEPFDWLFIPSDITGGNSSVPVGDYLYQNVNSTENWLAVLMGGDWTNSLGHGGFRWDLDKMYYSRSRTRGARLVYAKGGN